MKGGTYRVFVDDREELAKFVYEEGPVEIYEVTKDGADFVAQRVNVPLETQIVKVTGEIQSSLFEAMETAGEQDTLTLAFAEILAWEIDFYMDVREGDRFRIIVEKLYKGKEFIDYGTIHAVTYAGQERTITGIRYRDDYYDENEISEEGLLKSLSIRIGSRFSRSGTYFGRSPSIRRHPLPAGHHCGPSGRKVLVWLEWGVWQAGGFASYERVYDSLRSSVSPWARHSQWETGGTKTGYWLCRFDRTVDGPSP
jgi:hypothetical protein